MANFYLIPNWFFGYDIFLEVLFAVMAIFISFYAFKVYRLSQQREFGLLGASFLLISLSYFAWSIINVTLVRELNESMRVLILPELNIITVLGVFSHILLFMAGLVTLFYMTCKVQSDKMYSLMVILVTLATLFAHNKPLSVYILSSIILTYIAVYYGLEYRRTKNKRVGLTFLSFALLFWANFTLIFMGTSQFEYVSAHLMELAAFSLLLYNLISILKHGKEKKSS